MHSRSKNILVLSVIFIYAFLLFLKKIFFITADLGRHIQNGKMFLQKGIILKTNFYSYTQPNFPTITHHWGSGVVFYIIWLIGKFPLLSIFYAAVAGLTAVLWFRIAEKLSNTKTSLISLFIVIPFIVNRTEIRPEIFSYLLTGLYLFLILNYQNRKISFVKLLITLTVLQTLWVNLHIFFVLGLVIPLLLVVHSLMYKNIKQLKLSVLLLVSLTLASILNPYGIKGIIEPLIILKHYGYMIAENQSVIFAQKRLGGIIYLYFETINLFLIILWGVNLIKNKLLIKKQVVLFLLTVIVAILSWRFIRMFPMFGYVLISSLSYTISANIG